MIVGPTVGGMEPGRNEGRRPLWRGVRAEAGSAMEDLLVRGFPAGIGDCSENVLAMCGALMMEALRTGAPVPHFIDCQPDSRVLLSYSVVDESLLPAVARLGLHVVFDSAVGERLVVPLQGDVPVVPRKIFLASQAGDLLSFFLYMKDHSYREAPVESKDALWFLHSILACTDEGRTRGVVDAVLACTRQWVYEKQPERGADLHALMRIDRDLSIRRMGRVTAPLDPVNYSAQVLAGFGTAVADLTGEHPGGRIIILDGPPGTGKTYLVRALMDAVGDERGTTFLLVSPEAIGGLAGMEVLPVLVEHHSGTGPIVLILEDADSLLAARRGATMDRISSVLNLGDGLLGEALNLRLIVTTNAPIKELDPALLRPGRLSVRISIGELGVDAARAWWKGKGGDPAAEPRGPATLAALYSALRGAGGSVGPEMVSEEGV